MTPTSTMTVSERADALEHKMMEELDLFIAKSNLSTLGERQPGLPLIQPKPGQKVLQGDDPRLPKMPDKPTLFDFFKLRFGGSNHVMQSAALAQRNGCNEKVILACLLHDMAVMGFIRSDHGYWGAQLVAPYVDEEVAWAIRYHQALRFYPDPNVGYEYPAMYLRLFGDDYKPEPYIEQDYKFAREHKWYMTSRLVTMNDLYAFDPNSQVKLEDFTDIVGRHFRQPKEGLGFDGSPVAHMWRTLIWPTRFL
jgi:hypothetical protein